MASRAILMRGLSCVHGKNLTSLVVSTRRAGGVTAHTGAALWALRKLRSMPTVGGLTGAQAHLRGFAFWNSHKIRIIDFLIFQSLQFVQSAPRRIAGRLRGIGGRLRKACWTDLASIRITSGMSRQSKMYIFPYLRGQVNQLPSVEFPLKGERLDDQLGLKLAQAGHAPQADAETETSRSKDPAAGNTNVQCITD